MQAAPLVPLCQLNGAEAERMLEDLARPPRLPARMKQPPPPPPPLPPAKPVDDPVQLRIEQLMATLDIEGAALPALAVAHADPVAKPAAPPALLRPPNGFLGRSYYHRAANTATAGSREVGRCTN